MTQFNLDQNNRFVITGYAKMRPFSSFLPGIAGLMGVPLWAFYINRGQAIASFGIENKDVPIMEFFPANQAYQNTPFIGFRTFLKIENGDKKTFYEPFAPWNGVDAEYVTMTIGLNDLELQEVHPTLDLQTQVRYYILPNEPFAGLVRQVTIKNKGKSDISFDVLDGMPRLIPYGVNNNLLKEMGRTVEAWMEVYNLGANVPFYRICASVIDRAEVETFQSGHFAVAFVDDGKPLQAIVDPVLVFGQETSLYTPLGFTQQSLHTLLAQTQITCGRTPCSFFAHHAGLAPGEDVQIYCIYGHIGAQELLDDHLPRVIQASYLQRKYEEAITLTNDLTHVVDTHTSSPIFDAYCRQNFFDNVLRGGWPVKLAGHYIPVYARKHGDLERDYNAFSLAAEPFSQGEGSYRDINQNRRSNVLLNPDIEDFDIRAFISLIQADGYNPRSIKGYSFSLTLEKQKLVLTYVSQPDKLRDFLAKPFSPGKLLRAISEKKVELLLSPQEFFLIAMKEAVQDIGADFHEGFWIDHWEYNLDLIESYLAVYPDRKEDIFFGTHLPFYDCPMTVQPRSKKYVLANGIPRQLNSLMEEKEKVRLISDRSESRQWTRSKDGNIYLTSLYSKLLLIVLIKFSTLDPWGMGIEMEAGRPGWDDALNGLPALFGSGMAETYELFRWLEFLQRIISAHPKRDVQIPVEAGDLLEQVHNCLEIYNQSADSDKDYIYWDAVSTARENYRQRTRLGFDGDEETIQFRKLGHILTSFQIKVNSGIKRANKINPGVPPTYFFYIVDEYDILQDYDPHGYAYIRPRRFTPKSLPPFLEGPMRTLKILPNGDSAINLYRNIKESALFDKKLSMYKLNASLENQSQDIGRARAFPPGWLENESIWLHMEYKYLLEILKAGLFEQFYADMKDILVPFLDPHTYGRSTLENSSFLVSSAHPDASLHGAGFVARLSGATAEFLSIWNIMMAGKQPFFVEKDKLHLALHPALPAWLFTDDGTVSFRFLGRCMVTYHNPEHMDTHDRKPMRIEFIDPISGHVEIPSPDLVSPYADMVRNGLIKNLDIWL